MQENKQQIIERVDCWLNKVVIGLQLCPFALKPIREARHKICVSDAESTPAVLTDLQRECECLASQGGEVLETTLIVLPNALQDFYMFNTFLSLADKLIKDNGWEGEYQLASFHPRYQFSGTQPEDAENLTNSAPYPILHILRESSVTRAIESYPDIDDISRRNILRMQNLTRVERETLFFFR